ncbi:MAG: nuclear pore complex protein Nup62 [Bacillariaceae sp.]
MCLHHGNDKNKDATAPDTSNANTTPTAASTTTGGFSFGGANATPTTKATTPTTPAGVATPGAPAPVSTPATTFNINNNNSTTTTPAATAPAAATSAPAPPVEPPALEYQTLTVEEILNKFQRQLEEDSLAFAEEAKRVCAYDAVLRDSQRDLAKLTTEAQRLMIEQDQVEDGLNTIGAFQNQLGTILAEVEDQVGTIFQTQNHLNPADADLERERSYETAKKIEYQLDDVTNSLRETFDTLNQANASAYGASGGDGFSDGGSSNDINSVNDVVTVLNRHQDGLAELEAAAQKLELDCVEVFSGLQTSRR